MENDEFVCNKINCDSCGFCVLINFPDDDEEVLEQFFKILNK